jgi:hypothetical protein
MTIPNGYMNQTELGRLFGCGARTIGSWLTQIGLRDGPNRPSKLAMDGGYVQSVPIHDGSYHRYWVWHIAETVKALEGAGHPLLHQP